MTSAVEQRSGNPVPGALAAIDIGTNSVHMLIARVAGNGRFEVITRQKEMVRLGSGQGEMKELESAAIDRGVAALARCRSLADSFDAPVFAVATSAVREALNAEAFLTRAHDEAGVDVQVISGYEEARLIQLGVLQALPVFDKRLALIDVGGGSTEVLLGWKGAATYARSIKLGSLRMTRRFFPDGVVEGDAVERCRSYVANQLAPMMHEVADLEHDIAVASSGTAEALAAMVFARRGTAAPQTMNAATITRDELGAVIESLAAARTTEERRKLPGIEDSRADILLGGGIVLEQVCDALGVERLTISEYALREGVLLDALHRLQGGTLHHLSDLRRRSVFHLMELCDDEPEHSLQVARLALALHDELADRLDLDDEDRELLEAAALLCNVGLFISHSKHHKHSYYVIRNSEHLMGFTDNEIEVIAQIARYHRKSPPSEEKHPEFAALPDEARSKVRSLASILRVAIGLDRNHDAAVDRLRVQDQGDVLEILIAPGPGSDDELALEQYSADSRSRFLADRLGVPITVRVVEAEDLLLDAVPQLD
ncbi:MAG: Ppx/GppA family phosphatase [Actinomycetota bacterium]|nr:Ppx/GppA family phosphatase [Actinomycetota bacterium]